MRGQQLAMIAAAATSLGLAQTDAQAQPTPEGEPPAPPTASALEPPPPEAAAPAADQTTAPTTATAAPGASPAPSAPAATPSAGEVVLTTRDGVQHRGTILDRLPAGYLLRTADGQTIIVAYGDVVGLDETPPAVATAADPVRPVPAAPPEPPPKERASRAGASVAVGLGFSYAHLVGVYTAPYDVHHYLDNRIVLHEGDEVWGASSLFGMQLQGQFDYGFSEHVFLGLRLAFGGFVNSDPPAPALDLGPALTFFLGDTFYLGLDGLLSYLKVHDVGATSYLENSEGDDIDAQLVSFGPALRLGVAIEVTERFAITPELGLLARIGIHSPEGTLRLHSDSSGYNLTADVSQQYTFGGNLAVGFRWFL